MVTPVLQRRASLSQRMKGLVAAVGFAGIPVFGGGLVITIIQLYYTVRYLQAISKKTDLNQVATLMPWWSRPFMIDLALVAPALVCFTGACVIYGAWRILFRPAGIVIFEDFPFPQKYRFHYVQYGLLGTVIGFVIGFYTLDPKRSDATIILLAALSASLWSTLTAIALAYLFCPMIEAVFRKFLSPLRNVEEDPLASLGKHASAAASALERLSTTSSSADLSLGLQSVAKELVAIQNDLGKAVSNFQLTTDRVSSLEREITTIKSQVDETRVSLKHLDLLRNETVNLRKEIVEGDKNIRDALVRSQNRVEELWQRIVSDRQRWRDEIARVIKTGGALIERLRRSLEQ